MHSSSLRLANSLKDLFVANPHPATQIFTSVWPDSSAAQTPAPAKDLPVTRWLPDTARNAPAETQAFVTDIARSADALRWQQTYTEDDFGAEFLLRYGWTLFVGPDAPIKSDTILAGLLLLGPGIEYPRHQHSAEELYIILSGKSSWTIGQDTWTPLHAGQVVHNPPWQWHGMRTDQDDPVLLAVAWKAGKLEKSKIASG